MQPLRAAAEAGGSDFNGLAEAAARQAPSGSSWALPPPRRAAEAGRRRRLRSALGRGRVGSFQLRRGYVS